MAKRTSRIAVDEQTLRDLVLKAYHEARARSHKGRLGVDSVRQFLAGAPGGETVPGNYWFEQDPDASLDSFLSDLDRTSPALVASVFEPLLQTVRELEAAGRSELAPNPNVYVSSLSGSCAVKADLDETVAAGIVAATIIGLARLGRERFEQALERRAAD